MSAARADFFRNSATQAGLASPTRSNLCFHGSRDCAGCPGHCLRARFGGLYAFRHEDGFAYLRRGRHLRGRPEHINRPPVSRLHKDDPFPIRAHRVLPSRRPAAMEKVAFVSSSQFLCQSDHFISRSNFRASPSMKARLTASGFRPFTLALTNCRSMPYIASRSATPKASDISRSP